MGKDNTGLKFYGNIGFESNIQVSEVIEHQIIQKVAISETMFLVFFEQLLQQTCMSYMMYLEKDWIAFQIGFFLFIYFLQY